MIAVSRIRTGRRTDSASPAKESAGLVSPPASPTFLLNIGTKAALVHADIGTGYDDKDAVTLTWLPDVVARALGTGGVAISGLPLDHAALEPLALPASVDSKRYFLYRRRA